MAKHRRSVLGPFIASGRWGLLALAPAMGSAGAVLSAAIACSPGSDGTNDISVIAAEEPAPESESPESAPPMTPRAPTPADLVLVEAPPPPFCGDGALNDDEQCDDGGTEPGDGCSSNCLVVEQGYACPTPGSRCEQAAICGDALLLLDETCDDGNLVSGDGCTQTCQLEADFGCPVPGEPCVSTVVCGDGLVSGAEACDDGNAAADDGCSASCQTEEGWSCPIAGARCVPLCGDGLLRGLEQCDVGPQTSEGCSDTCGLEDGFVCNVPGEACQLTVCGNELAEGSEGCDDDNDRPFDGCFQCVREPACEQGECGAVCGDGLRYDSEGCDDGNILPGDGCDEACAVEAGFACVDQGGDGAGGTSFVLPVIYRDFIGNDTAGDGFEATRAAARAAPAGTANDIQVHPDFNTFTGTGVLGAVEDTLGADGLPVLVAAGGNFTSVARFNQWYRDTPNVNLPLVRDLTLDAVGDGSFVFDSAEAVDAQFDPILEDGWQTPVAIGGQPPTVYEGTEFCVEDLVSQPGAAGATPRNLSFTTETRFVFEYQGGEHFEFSGDDDVWVFVNNRLVVDLGGLHEVATGEFDLAGPGQAPGLATVTRTGPPGSALTLAAPAQIPTGMEFGGVYEVVLFHAERHECGSNFKLTLAGFDAPRSSCQEVCGDGVVTRSETCDEGEQNGGGYGFCADDCTPGPRCGDGEVQEDGGEACDNGFNIDRYSTNPTACAPGCTRPAFCGDAVVDPAFGEECDDGVNDNSYGGCSEACKVGPFCGDGTVNGGGEECDDNNRVNGDGCNLSCKTEREIIPS
jgi:fibro-slime domain-containing protein